MSGVDQEWVWRKAPPMDADEAYLSALGIRELPARGRKIWKVNEEDDLVVRLGTMRVYGDRSLTILGYVDATDVERAMFRGIAVRVAERGWRHYGDDWNVTTEGGRRHRATSWWARGDRSDEGTAERIRIARLRYFPASVVLEAETGLVLNHR